MRNVSGGGHGHRWGELLLYSGQEAPPAGGASDTGLHFRKRMLRSMEAYRSTVVGVYFTQDESVGTLQMLVMLQ